MSNEQQDKKKEDILVVAQKEAERLGKYFRISTNYRMMFFFGLFQSGIFILYAIFNYVVYFDMLLLLSLLYLVLAYGEFSAKRKERKQQNATPKTN